MRPRILVVGQVPPPHHGQAIMVETLLRGRYADVDLVHLDASYSDHLDDLGRVSVRKVGRMLAVVLRAVWARVLRRTDVLYYHPAGANRSAVVRDAFVLTILRPLFRCVVFHHHAMGAVAAIDQLPGPLRRVARRALRGADVAIAPSSALRDEALLLDPARAVVVPNGTPGGEPRGERHAPTVPRILFLNLVSEAKGAWWLLDAVAALHARGVRAPVTFAGTFASEDARRAFLARCAELELDPYVHLPGLVSGPAKWTTFASADVFCVPTTYAQESFGLAMVEAASCGAAVVTTDTPGVREVFEPDVSAVLVDPDRPESLADALAELCRDPARRADLGRNAAALHAERYTLEHFWQGMDQAFTNLPSWSSSRSRERSSP